MTTEGQPDVVSDKRVETELYEDQVPPHAPGDDRQVDDVVAPIGEQVEALTPAEAPTVEA